MDEVIGHGEALEKAFFYRSDRVLLEKLKNELKDKEVQDALAAVSGIEDETVLGLLVQQRVTPESLSAVSLIPLVSVAWCDAEMESAEKDAILKAADSSGIAKDTAAYELLGSWLGERPGDDLLAAWQAYVGVLKVTLDESAFSQLKASVTNRAESIAESAGGFLGFGTVSEKEKEAMAEISKAVE